MAGTELAVYQKVGDVAIFAESQADAISAAIKCDVRAGRAWAIVLMRRNMDVLDFIQDFHFIEGRPVKRSDAAIRDFRTKLGGQFRMLESTPEIARQEYIDAHGNKTEVSLTWQEAQQEDWPWVKGKGPGSPPTYENLKNNWRTPKGREMMLWWRLTSMTLKKIAPEILSGLGLEDADYVQDGETVTQVAKPPSAQEVLARMAAENAANESKSNEAKSAEPIGIEALPPGTVIDAEFEVKTDSPQTFEQAVQQASAADSSSVEPQSADGTITVMQRTELQSLIDSLGMPPEKVSGMLAKRKVNSIRSLSKEQADEILSRLRDLNRSSGPATPKN